MTTLGAAAGEAAAQLFVTGPAAGPGSAAVAVAKPSTWAVIGGMGSSRWPGRGTSWSGQ